MKELSVPSDSDLEPASLSSMVSAIQAVRALVLRVDPKREMGHALFTVDGPQTLEVTYPVSQEVEICPRPPDSALRNEDVYRQWYVRHCGASVLGISWCCKPNGVVDVLDMTAGARTLDSDPIVTGARQLGVRYLELSNLDGTDSQERVAGLHRATFDACFSRIISAFTALSEEVDLGLNGQQSTVGQLARLMTLLSVARPIAQPTASGPIT